MTEVHISGVNELLQVIKKLESLKKELSNIGNNVISKGGRRGQGVQFISRNLVDANYDIGYAISTIKSHVGEILFEQKVSQI